MFLEGGILTMDYIMILAIFLVLGLYLVIGIRSKRKADLSAKHFLSGNKEIPWFIATVSDRASACSGYWTVGVPGTAYAYGLASIWIGIGCVIPTYINWLCLAKRMKALTNKYGVLTMTDMFAERTQDQKNILRGISAIVILIFMTAYLSSQIVAQAKVFQMVFETNFDMSVWISAIFILLYTMIGGYFAVASVNTIQGFLMLFTLFVAPVVAIVQSGGFGTIVEKAHEIDPLVWTAVHGMDAGHGAAWIIGMVLGMAIPCFGQPHIMNSLIVVEDTSKKTIRRCTTLGPAFDIVNAYTSAIIGIVALALFSTVITDPEQSIYYLINNFFGSFFGGILISGVIAAIMSTAAAMLMVITRECVDTIYCRLIKKTTAEKLPAKKGVLLSRWLQVPIMLAAVIYSLQGGSAFGLVMYAFGGMGAAFTPVLFGTLFWKRMTHAGAIACIVGGTVIYILWTNLGLSAYMFDIYQTIPVTIISALLMVVVSLMTKPPTTVEEDFNCMLAVKNL